MNSFMIIFQQIFTIIFLILMIVAPAFGFVDPQAVPPNDKGPLWVFETGPYAGRVGIATTTPDAKLTVGSFRATGIGYLTDKLGIGIPPDSGSPRLQLSNGSLTQSFGSVNPSNIPVLGGSGLTSMPAAPALRLKVQGRYAYVSFKGSGRDAFRIIDVSDPSAPRVVGGQSLTLNMPDVTATAFDIDVAGKYAYLTFSGAGINAFRIIDVSNPFDPVVVGGVGLSTNMPSTAAKAVFVSGRYAYVTFDGIVGPNTNVFRIIDVGDPDTPNVVGGQTISVNTETSWGIYVSGRYAYAAFGGDADNRFRIIDVSDPANPTVVCGTCSSVGSLGVPLSINVSGRYAYMNIIGSEIVRVIDVSNPANPQPVGQATVGFVPNSLQVNGNYVFVVQSGHISVVNISNPTSPLLVALASVFPSGGISIFVSGRYAYATLFTGVAANSFRILDVSGIEGVAAQIQSVEAGSLQVRENAHVDNNLQVRGGLNVGGAGLVAGYLSVTGNLSKPIGSFLIDHPLDPLRKRLRHSFTESPDMKNIYDGIVVLDENGEAKVKLPDYFDSLNKDFRYQISSIDKPSPNLYVKEEIENNSFIISGGAAYAKVSWQVTGIRKDRYAKEYPIIVEEEKAEPGYLYPEVYSKSR